MQTKLKVGDNVLHVSGANIDGYDNKRGEIMKIDESYLYKPTMAVLIKFEDGVDVWCYSEPIDGITLDLRLLNPPPAERLSPNR